MKKNIKDSFNEIINEYDMLKKGDTVVVGLSGGADSVCLLYLLTDISKEYSLTVKAAHVNHMLRGKEADRDEMFVRKLCSDLSIELKVLKADVSSIAKESGQSTEEAGRNIRYGFFDEFGTNVRIATAHNLDDCIETMLFNVSRGSGLHGLCGIQPVRGNIIRPMLYCSGEDIREYCRTNNIEFVNDSTNQEDIYSRNLIRHNVMPGLVSLNPAFYENAGRCIENLRLDDNYIDKCACNLLDEAKCEKGYYAEALLKSDISIQNRALYKIVKDETLKSPEKKHIELLKSILQNGGAVQLNDSLYFKCEKGVLFRYIKPFESVTFVTEPGLCEYDIPGAHISLTVINSPDIKNIKKNNKDMLDYCVDYDKISYNRFFRSRKPADIFTSGKRHVTKTVKKLFNEAAILPELRNSVAVLESDGKIAFIEGFGPADDFKVNDNTKNILKITIERNS